MNLEEAMVQALAVLDFGRVLLGSFAAVGKDKEAVCHTTCSKSHTHARAGKV
jgi:hypothetical protein